MADQYVLYSTPGPHLAEIRLNRPERLNALVEPLVKQLVAALQKAEADPDVRVVILSGEGRAFCAGADYKEHVAGQRSDAERRDFVRWIVSACRTIFLHRKPVVAAIHGYAVGAGAEMSLNCDFLLMEEGAQIGLPEIAIGTFVGGGVTLMLPRIVGLMKARELIMMADRISSQDALAAGLANRCFPKETFRDDVLAFASRLASRAPLAVQLSKRHINSTMIEDYDAVSASELEGVFQCQATEDWQEGVRSFAEKREPRFTGK